MSKSRNFAIALVAVALATTASAQSAKHNIGRVATPQEFAGWDIDVRPDGRGLPPGKGSVREGEQVYMTKCAACHGEFGEIASRRPQVARRQGFLSSVVPVQRTRTEFARPSIAL